MSRIILEPYMDKEGYFVDNGTGEPIHKTDHIFNFVFHTFSCSNRYSIHRPATLKKDKNGKGFFEKGLETESENQDVRIEMIPSNNNRYSYIGTRELIKKYTLIISDLDDHMCKHNFPYLRILPRTPRDNHLQTGFSIFLFLDKSRLEKIRQDILGDKISFGDLRFSLMGKGDVVFTNDFKFSKLSKDYIENNELDPVKYRHKGCTYPYKILPTNFSGYDSTLLTPYDDQPIREFDLTFGKTVINQNIDTDDREEQDDERVLDAYVEEWMWKDLDEEE